jgi:ABC-2 type transport system permease protein
VAYYLRLIRAFMRTSFQRETSFRSNFYINLLNTCLNLVTGLAGVSILFGQMESFQGWTYAQALTLLGVFMLVGTLLDINLWPSLNTMGGLDGEIWVGTFDFTLLKPVNTQFYISFRNWEFWQFVELVIDLAVLGWGVSLMGQGFTAVDLLWFLLMLLMAVVLGYAILLILETGAFYYLGAPLTWIFSAIMSMGRYPIGIYPGWIRLILTWIVPVGFMVTVPTQALIGTASPRMMLASIGMATVLFYLSALFFRRSLKRYASASS